MDHHGENTDIIIFPSNNEPHKEHWGWVNVLYVQRGNRATVTTTPTPVTTTCK